MCRGCRGGGVVPGSRQPPTRPAPDGVGQVAEAPQPGDHGDTASGDDDQGALGPPAPSDQTPRSRPSGPLVGPRAAGVMVTRGRRQDRHARPGPASLGPGHRDPEPQLPPAPPTRFDLVAVRSAHRSTVTACGLERRTAAARQRLSTPHAQRPRRGEDGPPQDQHAARSCQARPDGTGAATMRRLKPRGRRPPHAPQGGGDGPGASRAPTTQTWTCGHPRFVTNGATVGIKLATAVGPVSIEDRP